MDIKQSRPSKPRKACSECARLKEKCDTNRPCQRCVRVKRPELCTDQSAPIIKNKRKADNSKRKKNSDSSGDDDDESITAPPPKKLKSGKAEPVEAACVPCHRKKKRCDRKKPCSRCIRQKTSGACVYPPPKAPAGEGRELVQSNWMVNLVSGVNDIWPTFNLVMDSQPTSFDFVSNYVAAHQMLLNISPLEITDVLTALPQHILLLFSGLATMMLSPPLAQKIFSDLRETIDYSYRFGKSENASQCLDRMLSLTTQSTLPDAVPNFTVRPVAETPDLLAVNSRDIYAGLEPIEAGAILYYLDRFVPETLEAYLNHSIPGSRPSCFLIRMGVPSAENNLSPVSFFLNKEAESMFGYTSQELQYFADVRDLQNLWTLRTTGQSPPPGAFL
jgi:hypothetical protein